MSVDYSADLPALYATFGEPVTVAGSLITAIFFGGQVDAVYLAAPQRTLRCIASDVAGVVPGAAVVLRGANYTVRAVEPMELDELETMLILERA